MIVSTNCKINIGLNVVTKRKDGYHDIESLMYPVLGFHDTLEIDKNAREGIEFSASGLTLDCPPEKNLCVLTYNEMRRRFPDKVGGVKVHLHKAIPSGAGLGGGSSNVAAMIKALNEMFDLALTSSQMEETASTLGSDTAFFIRNIPLFVAGRGELLYPAQVSLKGYKVVILKPDVSITTADAYKMVKPRESKKSLSRLIKHPIESWRGYIGNDFEEVMFPRFPEIEKAKATLYQRGAVYASMSGSGSAVYGIFLPGSNPKFDDVEIFIYQEDMA